MSMDFDYIDRMLIVRINGDIDHHSCEGIKFKIDKEIAKRSPRGNSFRYGTGWIYG